MSKDKILKATHGSDKTPLELGEIKIPCYVLSDGTRVFSGRGIQKALGATATSGVWLNKFVNSSPITPYLKTEVLEQLNRPIKFTRPQAGGSQSSTYGYEVTILIDICDAILEANKTGDNIDKPIIDSAALIIRAVAKVGIIALVDEVTGYQYEREKDELQKVLKLYISSELLPWQKRFPDEFYKEIFRLNNWDYTVSGIKQRPGVIGSWTKKYIYQQLPRGVLAVLIKNTPKTASGKLSKRLHQSLTDDIGNPHLEKQLVSVITLMNVSKDWDEFNRLWNKKFGQQGLDFWDDDKISPKPPTKPLSPFDKQLKGLLAVPPPKKGDKK